MTWSMINFTNIRVFHGIFDFSKNRMKGWQFVATFWVNNMSIYRSQCGFLVLGWGFILDCLLVRLMIVTHRLYSREVWKCKKFSNMAIAMFYGSENVSGSAFIKSKNLKNFFPRKVGWHRSFRLELALAQ